MKVIRNLTVGVLLIVAGLPAISTPTAAMPPEAIVIHYDHWAFGVEVHRAVVTKPADCVTNATGGVVDPVTPTTDHVTFPGAVGQITVVCEGEDRCEDLETMVKVGTTNTQVTGRSECGARSAEATVNGIGTGDDRSPGHASGAWICRADVTGSNPHWYDVKCKNLPHPSEAIVIDRPVGNAAAPTVVTHPTGCTTMATGGTVTSLSATTDEVTSTAAIIEVTCNAIDVCQDVTVNVATNAFGTTVKGETECGSRTASAQATGVGGLATGSTNGAADTPWVCKATALTGGSTAVYRVDCTTA